MYKLLKQFIEDYELNEQYEIFYSPVSLNKIAIGGKEWAEEIYKTMKKSYCCLVLVTPNSVGNKWVNYELGLANAWRKTIQPVCTFGIQFSQFILNSKQVVALEDKDNIGNVIYGIFPVISLESIDNWLLKDSIRRRVSKIWINAKRRCVYIVGSCHLEKKEDAEYNRNLSYFVRSLSERLLDNDCVLASYPIVPNIGEVVAKCAVEKDFNKFEIAGLYGFDKDKELEKFATKNNINLSQWNEILSKFRNVYLEGKDFMIIIGGGSSTENEYEIAKKKIGLQVIPIPCFGGFAKRLYDRKFSRNKNCDFMHPCAGCEKLDGHGVCRNLDKFVERIKVFKSHKD